MLYILFSVDDVFHNKKILISWKSHVENILEVSEALRIAYQGIVIQCKE